MERFADQALTRNEKRQRQSINSLERFEFKMVEVDDNVRETSLARRSFSYEAGYNMINNYKLLKDLGHGSFGKVKLCVEMDSGKQFAIKIIDKTILRRREGVGVKNNFLGDVLKEIAIMKKLRHPNIVELREVINDPHHDKIYIVQEFMEKGALMADADEGRWVPLPLDQARKRFRDILSGLEYLHFQKIIHR